MSSGTSALALAHSAALPTSATLNRATVRVNLCETDCSWFWCVGSLLLRFVDPRDRRNGRWRRDLANEAFGVLGVGIEEDHAPSFSDLFGPAVVNVGGSVQSDA